MGPLIRLLFVALLAVPGSAVAAPGPCGTPGLMPGFLPPVGPAEPFSGVRDKDNRNPYSVPNELVTDDFVVRWGNDWTPNTAGIDVLADALQDAWQTQIVDLAHPTPWSADSWRINVYIGDTGDGAPPAFDAGGYFTPDEEGYPILVINRESLNEAPWTRVVALHELYHAVQWGLDSYSYDDDEPGAWYWEATASWIPSVTDPASPANGTFLFGFALLPHLPLDHFDYPDSGSLDEYHQYGAFIFPTFLVESGFGPEIIRDSWVAPAGGTRDPIEALRGRLAEEGEDLDGWFTEFVASNAFWDYVHGDYWQSVVDNGQPFFPDSSPVTAWVPAEGTQGFVTPDVNVQTRRYGANYVRLDDLTAGEWVLSAAFDSEGSQGSPASFGATLVRNASEKLEYTTLTLEDLDDGVVFEAGGALALAVAAWSPERRSNERFPWSWSVVPWMPGDDDDAVGDDDDTSDDDDDDTSDDDDLAGVDDDGPVGGFGGGGQGCRCSSSTPSGGLPLALLLLYGIVTPRSRRRSAASSRRVPSG